MTRGEKLLTRNGFAHVAQFKSHTTPPVQITATKRKAQKSAMK
jgi:hypothetical protein